MTKITIKNNVCNQRSNIIFPWYTGTSLKQGPSPAVTRVTINNCLTELYINHNDTTKEKIINSAKH